MGLSDHTINVAHLQRHVAQLVYVQGLAHQLERLQVFCVRMEGSGLC